jgi:Lecithin retinol acyltransferase
MVIGEISGRPPCCCICNGDGNHWATFGYDRVQHSCTDPRTMNPQANQYEVQFRSPVLRKEEPPLGAHIVTPRRGFRHHGIYVGSGKVVHYAGLARGLRRGPVEEVSLDQFARGQAVLVLGNQNARFPEREVIRRARSRVGEDKYRLFTNNCEHFCEWCLSGEPRSHQVEVLLTRPSHALMVLLTLFAAVVANSLTAVLINPESRA